MTINRAMARVRSPLGVFLLALTIAVVLTYPLVGSLAGAVPHDLGDPLLNVWLLSWNARRVPFSHDWWNVPFFFPVPGVAAFSEHVVGEGLLTSPLLLCGVHPVAAYNLAFLLSFPLCALSAYLLCRSLTGRPDAALVGGLAFGFAPYRAAQLPHLDVLSCYWMPLALLGRHGYLRDRRARWLGLFAASWLLQVLCKGYSFFHLSVLVLLWVVWFAPPWREPRATARIAVAWIFAALPLAPVFLQYRSIHQQYGLERERRVIEAFSADLASVTDGSPLLANWTSLFGGDQETWLFPGGAAVALVVSAALWGVRLQRVADDRHRKARLLFALGAATFAIVAVSRVVVGRWRLDLGVITVSVSAMHKPLALAWAFLLLALATAPRVVDAFRRRSCFAFYALAAVAMWLFSLGPSPRGLGALVWDKAPYWWLLHVPRFTALRVPARFWIGTVLCLSVAASIAFAFLTARLRRPWIPVACAVAAVGVLRDGWITRLPMASPPPRSEVLESPGAAEVPVLELPAGGLADSAALYRSIFHGRPLVNGFSGYEPPHYLPLRIGLERRDCTVLDALAVRTGSLHVAVTHENDPDRSCERWVAACPGAQRIGSGAVHSVYAWRAAAATPGGHGGSRLMVRAIRANVADATASRAIDGNPQSRWTTGDRQRGDEKIVVDLGAVHRLGDAEVLLGRFVTDFPRELVVELSTDGTRWVEAWRGPTAGLAVSACLTDPLRAPVSLSLGGRPARFLRLRQVGEDPLYHWSVAEIVVHGLGAR